MAKTLTDSFVKNLAAPATGRTDISDARCRGLVIRVTPAGVKSWCFRFRAPTGGANARATIGAYPDISLGTARATADRMREAVALGKNPAAERRERRAGGRSFADLAARYLTEHAQRHKRASSAAADNRNLRKHVLPKWGRLDYRAIRRADVIELVESIIATGKGTLANRVHALVSKIFSFAVDASLIEAHPCHRMQRRGVENVGRRVLSDAEIRLFWPGVVERPNARQTGLGLRLALLTGCRVGEVAGLSRAELQDIESPTSAAWLIPGERTKNGKAHLVPLAPIARSVVIDLLAMIEPSEQFLLPTRSRGRSGPMRSNSLTQSMAYFSGHIAASEHGEAGASWRTDAPTPHDLRRTLETRLASLGIPKEIRDRCLNHIPGDVGSRHYNVHDYAPEKRAALTRWESAIGAILQGESNVVPLIERRGVA